MAKEDIEEVPVGELHSRLFGNPSSAVDQQPVQTNEAPLPAVPSVRQVEKSTGIKPPANVKVKDPNAEWVGKSAATAANTARENLNEVKPGSPIHSLVDEITNNWHIPALIVGGLGAAYLAKKAFGGGNPPDDNNPPNNPPRNNSERIEPTFHEPEKPALQTAQQTSETVASPETAQQLSSTEVPHTNSESITPEQMVQADKPASIPQGMTAETEVGKAPKDMGLVEAGDTNRELKAAEKQASAVEKELAKQGAVTPTSKTKKPAVPIFKTASDIPPGMVFRPDVGNLDRGLVNILGPEGRLYAKEVLNEGKMFGHAGADYNQKLKGLVSNYAEELKKITPSIDLTTREGRIAVGAPHTENYGSALGKAAKVGGVLGTLMTIAQSANAREAAGNVAESLLPIGMTPSEVQSGKLTDKQLNAYKEAQKLGSPYRSVPPPR